MYNNQNYRGGPQGSRNMSRPHQTHGPHGGGHGQNQSQHGGHGQNQTQHGGGHGQNQSQHGGGGHVPQGAPQQVPTGPTGLQQYPRQPYPQQMMVIPGMQHGGLYRWTGAVPAIVTPHQMIAQNAGGVPSYYAVAGPAIQMPGGQQAQYTYYQPQPAHPQAASYAYTQPQQLQANYRQVQNLPTVVQAQVPQPTVAQHANHHPQTHQQQQAPPAVSVPNIVQQVPHAQQAAVVEPRELPAPTQPPARRSKRILQIVDPNTGKSVINDEATENPPSTSPVPTVEHVGPSAISGDGYTQEEQSNANVPQHSHTPTPLLSGTANEPNSTMNKSRTVDDSSKATQMEDAKERDTNKVKTDFFQQIQRLADEGKNDVTEASLQSISSVSIEKYDVSITPEKVKGGSPSTTTVESGEPSSVGSSTRESTASPSLATAAGTQDRGDESSFITENPPSASPVPTVEHVGPNTTSSDGFSKEDQSNANAPQHSETPSPQLIVNANETNPILAPNKPRTGDDSSKPTLVDDSKERDPNKVKTDFHQQILRLTDEDKQGDPEASLEPISPIPIEKYDLSVTPEKDKGGSPSTTTIESGEPSSVGSSTRESTASPSLSASAGTRDRDDDSSVITATDLPEGVHPIGVTPIIKPEETDRENSKNLNNITRNLGNLTVNAAYSDLTSPIAQQTTTNKIHNGENISNNETEIMDPDSSDEDQLEEGELDEDSETPEPPKKTRITYDKDQLMQFQKSGGDTVIDFTNLPHELIKDGKPMNHMGGFHRGSSPGGFSSRSGATPRSRNDKMGGMHPSMRMNMGMQWGMGGMGGMGMTVPPPPPNTRAPKILEINREKVKLHKAEDAWKPSARKRGDKDDERTDEQVVTDEVVKKTRSILNKLTPENFDKLIDRFLNLTFEDNDDRIGAVIKVVFDKAVDEPNFSTAYAKMVQTVCQRSAETSKKFRKKILDQCQKEFQTGNTDEEIFKELEQKIQESTVEKEKEALKLELEEKRFMSRRRSLGNVRFIGELFKFSMLTPKIMVECINMLLATPGDEENYECLCKLLSTIGELLDRSLTTIEQASKQKQPKWNPEPNYMDKQFRKLKELSEDLSLSSRIRFALLDVYELRENGWKPRRDTNAPKTIEEVRRAAAREEFEEKNKLMSLPPAQPSQPGRSMPKKDEWKTVTSTSSNKSARFQNQSRPSARTSSGPPELIFAPAGGSFQMTRTGTGYQGGGMSTGGRDNSSSNKYQPPRFSRSTLDGEPTPPPSRDEIVREPPPPLRTPASSTSSRESSRPQTPTRDSHPFSALPARQTQDRQPLIAHDQSIQPTNSSLLKPTTIVNSNSNYDDSGHADSREAVKNILNEWVEVKKAEDTLDWIQHRFRDNLTEFIVEVGNLVCERKEEKDQRGAGELIKLLIKKELTTKQKVIEILKEDVVPNLPDYIIDIPEVTIYFSMFLVVIFFDEEDLSWLVPLGDNIPDYIPDDGEEVNEDVKNCWRNLVNRTLTNLKLRRSEEAVQVLFQKTPNNNRLPVETLPWIEGESVLSLSKKIEKVLVEQNLEVGCALTENSWDLREINTVKALIAAVCNICWDENSKNWDLDKLQKLLSRIRFPSSEAFIPCWKQAKDFIQAHEVDKDSEELLWDTMLKNNVISTETMNNG